MATAKHRIDGQLYAVKHIRIKSVGLSQRMTVVNVKDEEPTGLYDGFYVRTGRKE